MEVTSVRDDGGPPVDVVVVAYNSGRHIRQCLEALGGASWVDVVVVDNASTDGSMATISDLPARVLAQDQNLGFARACNIGWLSTGSPYVLFLNPDAEIDPDAIARLASVLDEEPEVGIVAPCLVDADGTIARSQRRFPTLRSTFSQALFLHRVFPRSEWADEVVHDESRYSKAGDVQWLSGACLLVRRETLERVGGWDETFVLYSEDTEICRAAWADGYRVRYEPRAVARHAGGGSAPRSKLLALLASSRVAYARKNNPFAVALGHRIGIALEALTHMIVCRGGVAQRRGHAAALLATFQPARTRRLIGT